MEGPFQVAKNKRVSLSGSLVASLREANERGSRLTDWTLDILDTIRESKFYRYLDGWDWANGGRILFSSVFHLYLTQRGCKMKGAKETCLSLPLPMDYWLSRQICPPEKERQRKSLKWPISWTLRFPNKSSDSVIMNVRFENNDLNPRNDVLFHEMHLFERVCIDCQVFVIVKGHFAVVWVNFIVFQSRNGEFRVKMNLQMP